MFYAILAIIVGSLVIAIGGGGIHPMRNGGTVNSKGSMQSCPGRGKQSPEPISGSKNGMKWSASGWNPEKPTA